MTTQISLALEITLIGMGLVFAAIFLLWIIMAILVRLTADKGDQESQEKILKHKAAVAAISVALARQVGTSPREFPLPPTALVSAWQAVMRTKMLNKRGPVR